MIEEYQITRVPRAKLLEFIDAWDDKREPERHKHVLIYCKTEDGMYIALDNTTENCWVEAFRREVNAISWLNGEFEYGDELEYID